MAIALRRIGRRIRDVLVGPLKPRRVLEVYGIRWPRALLAGVAAGLVWFLIYYSSLRLLPRLSDDVPFPYIHTRFDLADFLGSMLWPPFPTQRTWELGLLALALTLVACGLIYAFLLSWSLSPSTKSKAVWFGASLFTVCGLTLWLANGFQPAIMRNLLPDTGFFLMGWTLWATLQLLISFLAYGCVLHLVYKQRDLHK